MHVVEELTMVEVSGSSEDKLTKAVQLLYSQIKLR